MLLVKDDINWEKTNKTAETRMNRRRKRKDGYNVEEYISQLSWKAERVHEFSREKEFQKEMNMKDVA